MITGGVIFAIVANVFSTVGIVIVNKYLYSTLHFEYMLTLSTIHFAFTSIVTNVLVRMGFVDEKPVAAREIIWLCVGSVGSVGFFNLALAHNTVGFYQLSKLLCIPATLVMQYYMLGKGVSAQVKACLAVILLGVGVAQVSDVGLNFMGSVYAGAAVLSTTLAQIYTNTKQAELKLNALQLLHATAPLIAVGMAMLIPVFDQLRGPKGLYEFSFTSIANATIFLTCNLAVGVNVSNYIVIGKTSPITYQVVGHMKTCLILVFGFVVFKYPPVPRNIVGICIAVVGMIAYSEVKRIETAPPPPPKPEPAVPELILHDDDADEVNGPTSSSSK